MVMGLICCICVSREGVGVVVEGGGWWCQWLGDLGHFAEGKAAFGGWGRYGIGIGGNFVLLLLLFFVILCHSNKTILVVCTSNFLSKSSL